MREGGLGLARVEAERHAHDPAQRRDVAQDRHEVGIGQRREVSARLIVRDTQNDQSLLEIPRVAAQLQDRVIFLVAVFGLLILGRSQRNGSGALVALLHHPQEIRRAEMLVLIERRPPRLADDLRDQLRRALVRARPRDEKIRLGPIHAPPPPIAATGSLSIFPAVQQAVNGASATAPDP